MTSKITHLEKLAQAAIAYKPSGIKIPALEEAMRLAASQQTWMDKIDGTPPEELSSAMDPATVRKLLALVKMQHEALEALYPDVELNFTGARTDLVKMNESAIAAYNAFDKEE